MIEVHTSGWMVSPSTLPTGRTTTLVDRVRFRSFNVVVRSGHTTRLLKRGEAGKRGEPIRDLTAKAEKRKARSHKRTGL